MREGTSTQSSASAIDHDQQAVPGLVTKVYPVGAERQTSQMPAKQNGGRFTFPAC